MQRFLAGLQFKIKSIVRHHQYHDMNDLLHHALEAEAQLAEEAQFSARAVARSRFTQPAASTPQQSNNSNFRGNSSSKQDSGVSRAKTAAQPSPSDAGSSISTARNRDMKCHTCGSKGHFK